ncbi:MAG: hypothetical protein ACPG32_12520 [Akkermansiaceae bacterium]
MKRTTLSALVSVASLALLLPAQALDQRQFFSADKSKSFKGTLTAFDSKTKKVTVMIGSGKTRSFALSVLSKECQEYVKKNEELLTIAKNIRLDLKEVKGDRQGDAIPTSYDIEVINRGQDALSTVELRYTLYYKQGSVAKGGTVDKTSTGKLTTGKLYDSDSMTLSTEKINIVRTIKKASGGG